MVHLPTKQMRSSRDIPDVDHKTACISEEQKFYTRMILSFIYICDPHDSHLQGFPLLPLRGRPELQDMASSFLESHIHICSIPTVDIPTEVPFFQLCHHSYPFSNSAKISYFYANILPA